MADSQAADIGARLRAEVNAAKNALAMEIAANLIEACPVDTGNARANFVPSIESPHDGQGGAAARAAGEAAVLGSRVTDDVYVTNNVPYLKFLIGGSSSQAPAGWDLVAIDQAVQTIQQQYDGVQIDVTDGRDARDTLVAITPREGQ